MVHRIADAHFRKAGTPAEERRRREDVTRRIAREPEGDAGAQPLHEWAAGLTEAHGSHDQRSHGNWARGGRRGEGGEDTRAAYERLSAAGVARTMQGGGQVHRTSSVQEAVDLLAEGKR